MFAIPPDQISYVDISLVDRVGRLFYWQGRVYRGIYPEAASTIKELFASGCLEELVRRNIFPASRITEYTLDGFALVVEHEVIPIVVYPHEWSFDMFRQAALVVLEVVEVAERFGWDIQDCSPYNILFKNTQPVYVDLGSFRF